MKNVRGSVFANHSLKPQFESPDFSTYLEAFEHNTTSD